MQSFKPILLSEPNKTSFKLLNYIKDQLFYSTLSTITLQLAKQAGVQSRLLEQLSTCLQKVKGPSPRSLLTFHNQNYQDTNNQTQQFNSNYDQYQKQIPIKEQIYLIKKMQSQLINSREKQNITKTFNQYAAAKQTQLIPLLNMQTKTKKDRFKNLLNRKNKSLCTTANYFQINTLDLLKNAYHNENNCYSMIRNFILLKTVFGHSMDNDPESNYPLYNVIFDQTGYLIISGGEQGQIKIWNRETGLLLSSLKGHQQYINKFQITKCNKYIWSAGGDGIRFFYLHQMSTLGGWKTQSIIDIASIYNKQTNTNKFMFGDKKNLYILEQNTMLLRKNNALSKDDFYTYKYSHRVNKESFLLMIQISSDQQKMLLGFETGDIMLVHLNDLFSIDPVKYQTDPLSRVFNLPIRHILKAHRDEMRELKWHKSNQYFVSGGKQGYCLLWEYKNQKVPFVIKQLQVSKLFNRRRKRAFGCNFISFNCTHTHFIVGFMQLMDQDDDDRGNGDLMAYSLQEKQVIFEFSKDMPIKIASVRGMETHPVYPNIVLVCEGTGRILLLDFLLKTIINSFELRGFHLLHPQFCLNPGDCKFSTDGRYFAVSTQFGSVSIFGYDLKSFYEICPTEQFFATDFTSFTLNENLRPIPIQGDLQIDMNRIERGQIRNIRGEVYQKQFQANFDNYWKQHTKSTSKNHQTHRNELAIKSQHQNYRDYLQKIKFNLKQAQNFNNFYSKNLQQIQTTKQSLLYEQKQKQYRIFTKILQEKLQKSKDGQFNNIPQLTHDLILQQIDAKGKRGGRRLIKTKQRKQYNNDNFVYNSANEQSYKASDDAAEEDDVMQLDYNVEDSDQMPYHTRRDTRDIVSQTRPHFKILRQNPRRYYNNDDQRISDEGDQFNGRQNQDQRKRIRKNPAEDVQQMLNDNNYLNYEDVHKRGRKKLKRNKISESEQYEEDAQNQKFIDDYHESDEEKGRRRVTRRNNQIRGSHIHNNRNSLNPRRGRPRKPQPDQNQQSESQIKFHRKRNTLSNLLQSNQSQFYESNEQKNPTHNLRTRTNQHNNKTSSSKKQQHINLGQCYRCGISPGVVKCNNCEIVCCQKCKQKRGKQNSIFNCYVCIYLNSTGSPVLDDKLITQQVYRFTERSHDVYIPQIDDKVRFFFQGYEQFLSHNIHHLNLEVPDRIQDYLLMPHIYTEIFKQALLETPLCHVKDIRYFFPYGNSGSLTSTYKRRSLQSQKKQSIHMLINLELQSKEQQLQLSDFWVYYIPSLRGSSNSKIESDNGQYLLREEIYQYIQQNHILQKLNENQTILIDRQEYQIVQKYPFQDQFPTTIWRQLKISKSDGKRLRNSFNRQAEKRCNVWSIDSLVPQISYHTSYQMQQYKQKLLQKINKIRDTQANYQLFSDFIDFTIYFEDYRKVVEVGICLNLIQQRIMKDFYRSVKSLMFDLNHMVNNSIVFNGEDNQVTEVGKIIRLELFKVVGVENGQGNEQVNQQVSEQVNQNNYDQITEKPQKNHMNFDTIQQKQHKKNTNSSFIHTNKRLNKIIEEQKHEQQPFYNLRNSSRYEDYPKRLKQYKNNKKRLKKQFSDDSSSEFIGKNIKNSDNKDSSSEQEQININQIRVQKKERSVVKNNSVRAQHLNSRTRRHDRVNEDYDKQKQVYSNIKSRSRRDRYIESSHDSHLSQQRSQPALSLSTRRSSRLNR